MKIYLFILCIVIILYLLAKLNFNEEFSNWIKLPDVNYTFTQI